MQYWINGPATNGIDDEIKIASILLIRLRRTSTPPFPYSIFRTNSKSKISLYFQQIVEIQRCSIMPPCRLKSIYAAAHQQDQAGHEKQHRVSKPFADIAKQD